MEVVYVYIRADALSPLVRATRGEESRLSYHTDEWGKKIKSSSIARTCDLGVSSLELLCYFLDRDSPSPRLSSPSHYQSPRLGYIARLH